MTAFSDAIRRLGVSAGPAQFADITASAPSASNEEIAELARTLAASGAVLDKGARKSADIASTGGPASLSTLLCPLYLRELNFDVPKLGVPGRPAGGVDSLGSIPGYTVRLSKAEAQQALAECGYAHFVAGSEFAPLDAALFHYRRKTGALAVPPLVIASLLAKKLAAGTGVAAIDVRASAAGNFGADLGGAKENARRFIAVARLLGIQSCCFVTPGNVPQQPYIGRGEALLALARLFKHEPVPELAKHDEQCWEMARQLAHLAGHTQSRPAHADIQRHFVANLAAQGASETQFWRRVQEIDAMPRREILAHREGYLEIDLAAVRDVLVTAQDSAGDLQGWPDPAGITLLKRPSSYVVKGEPLARLRSAEEAGEQLLHKLQSAFRTSPTSAHHGAFPMQTVLD